MTTAITLWALIFVGAAPINGFNGQWAHAAFVEEFKGQDACLAALAEVSQALVGTGNISLVCVDTQKKAPR